VLLPLQKLIFQYRMLVEITNFV